MIFIIKDYITMCAKKDNYYETVSWIENQIDYANPLEPNSELIQFVHKFEFKLINDISINPTLFKTFIDRIHNKAKTHFTNTMQQYMVDDIREEVLQTEEIYH